MKCAIYCRTSVENGDDKKTIESQLHELPVYAEKRGWEIVGIYRDVGLSGAYLDGRPDFKRLLDDMNKQKFELLLVTEFSRVTRIEDLEERGKVLGHLQRNNIILVSPMEGEQDINTFTGELMLGIQSSISAEEKRKIAARMKRGRLEKLRNGEYCLPTVPYGLKKRSEGRGKEIKHFVEKCDEERQVLRQLFDMIVTQGVSITQSSIELNKRAMKGTGPWTRKNRRWSPPNISSILSQEDSLTGTIIANKTKFKSKGIRNGKLAFDRIGHLPKEDWIRIRVPQLFSKKEYATLRKAISNNKIERPVKKDGENDPFLLRGMVQCGTCGKNYATTSGGAKDYEIRYYVCPNRLIRQKLIEGEKCLGPWVNAWALEHKILEKFMVDLWRNPKKILKQWNQAGHKKTVINSLKRDIASVEKKMMQKKSEKKRLLKLSLTKMWPEDMIEEEMTSIDNMLDDYEIQKAKLEKDFKGYEQMQMNVQALDESLAEMKKLKHPMQELFLNMPASEMPKLLHHFLQDSKIEIYPNSRPYWINLGNSRNKNQNKILIQGEKHVKINWEYRIKGKLDLTRIINILRTFEATGKVPLHYDRNKYSPAYTS